MVYPDLGSSFLNPNADSQPNYAGPFGRFLSALLDYFIFFPLVSFVMAILFRDSISVVSEVLVTGQFTSLVVQVFVFYILGFTLLQSVFIYYYSATPGQSFLKIYIKFDQQHSNLFFQIWLRQLGFVSSIFLLGLPFLAVLYHSKRRTFYDRLSESDVLTKSPENIFYLRDLDKKYIASGVSVALCFFTTAFFVAFLQSHQLTVNQFYASASRIPSVKKCFDLNNQSQEQRMKTALALNVLDIIPDECVVSEADALFGSNVRGNKKIESLAYYAKYLLAEKSSQSEFADSKDKYLKQACGSENKSDLCDKDKRGIASSDEDIKLNFLKKIMKK